MESFSNLAIVFFVTLPSDSFTDSKANTDSDDKIKQKEFSDRKKELYLLLQVTSMLITIKTNIFISLLR